MCVCLWYIANYCQHTLGRLLLSGHTCFFKGKISVFTNKISLCYEYLFKCFLGFNTLAFWNFQVFLRRLVIIANILGINCQDRLEFYDQSVLRIGCSQYNIGDRLEVRVRLLFRDIFFKLMSPIRHCFPHWELTKRCLPINITSIFRRIPVV